MIITKGNEVKDAQGNIYTLEKALPSGGFGKVFVAKRQSDQKYFAVKTILSQFPREEDYIIFQNEINSSLKVSSPHVIKYEFTHDGTLFNDLPPYIIMEYAPDGTLTDLINTRRNTNNFYSTDELLSIFMQLAEGMRDINKHIVHRDIKTDNILILGNKLKICDFGIAKFVEEKTRGFTLKGYGTYKYMAPETWRYDKNTVQMDIYSMGVVFYEMATLAYPYAVKQPCTYEQYKQAHLYQPTIIPRKFNPQLPSAIASLIITMLEKSLNKRFEDWNIVIKNIKHISSTSKDASNINSFVDKALQNQIEKDINIQEHSLSEMQRLNTTMEFCKLVGSQYLSSIYNPVSEFIYQFNNQYSNGKMRIDSFDIDTIGSHFQNTITLPGKKQISIKMQVLFDNFQRKVPSPFGGYFVENYIPECDKRKIYAWGKIESEEGIGYNLLLLENEEDDYGEWRELHNTNSGSSRTRRVEPFGFDLDELPTEIELIKAIHIYISKIEKFNIDNLYSFITNCLV